MKILRELNSTNWVAYAGGFVITVAVCLWLWSQVPNYVFEDALITYRYVENLASGQGFVYNPGEQIQGTTTPLYTIILALLNLCGLNHFVTGPILNVLANAGCVVLVGMTLRRWGLGNAILGMAISAMLPQASSWSISGMETGIYSFLCLLVLYLYLQRNHWGWAIASVAVILIRPDGVGVVLIVMLVYTVQMRRLPVREAGLIGLSLLPWIAFSSWYFGSPIPNSVLAKAVVYSAHSPFFHPTINNLVHLFLPNSIFTFGTLRLLLAFLGIVACFKFARSVMHYMLWFVIYYSLLALSRTHLHPWYLVPPLHVYSILTVLGLILLIRSLWRFLPKARSWWPLRSVKLTYVCVALVLILVGAFRLDRKKVAIAQTQKYEDSVRKVVGLWLRQNTPANVRVYMEPIGYIGYYSERYVLDAAGLVSPQFIPLNAIEGFKHCLKIDSSRPDYVVLRMSELRDGSLCDSNDSFWRQEYVLVKTFPAPPDLDKNVWPAMVIYKRQPQPSIHIKTKNKS